MSGRTTWAGLTAADVIAQTPVLAGESHRRAVARVRTLCDARGGWPGALAQLELAEELSWESAERCLAKGWMGTARGHMAAALLCRADQFVCVDESLNATEARRAA